MNTLITALSARIQGGAFRRRALAGILPCLAFGLLLGCGGSTDNSPVPTIAFFNPTQGMTGSTVAVTGSGFSYATGAYVGGVAVPSVFNSSTDLLMTFAIPAAAVTGPIVVSTSAGSVASSTNFVVVPQITSISPTSGHVGTVVTLTGSGFVGATHVSVGNESLIGSGSAFTVVNANQVKVTVGPDATTGPVVVTASGVNSAVSGPVFTVN